MMALEMLGCRGFDAWRKDRMDLHSGSIGVLLGNNVLGDKSEKYLMTAEASSVARTR
jgi:hypothetical protein